MKSLNRSIIIPLAFVLASINPFGKSLLAESLAQVKKKVILWEIQKLVAR